MAEPALPTRETATLARFVARKPKSRSCCTSREIQPISVISVVTSHYALHKTSSGIKRFWRVTGAARPSQRRSLSAIREFRAAAESPHLVHFCTECAELITPWAPADLRSRQSKRRRFSTASASRKPQPRYSGRCTTGMAVSRNRFGSRVPGCWFAFGVVGGADVG